MLLRILRPGIPLLLSATFVAAGASLAPQTNLAASYYQNGEYQKSEAVIRVALQAPSLQSTASENVLALNALGMALRAQGKVTEAERVYTKALAERGSDTEAIALVDYNYGRMCLDLGRSADAERLGSEALKLREGGGDAGRIAQARNLVGLVDLDLNRREEAIQSFEQALKNPGRPEVAAESLINLGTVYRHDGNLQRARPYFEQAIAKVKPFPEHRELLATGLNDLGLVAQQTGELKEAEALLTEALEVWESPAGAARIGRDATLSNLGVVKEERHRFAEAQALYEQALQLDEAAFGVNSPTVGIDLVHLGTLLCGRGDEAGGRAYLERALEEVKSAGRLSIVSGLGNGHLGLIAYKHKDWQEAECLLGAALANLQQTMSPTDTRRAQFLSAYADTLKHNGRYAESEQASMELAKVQYHYALHK